MLDVNNQESDTSENGNKKYGDSTDGREVGTSKRLDQDDFSIEEKRRDLADLALWLGGLQVTKLPLDDAHSLCNGRAFAEILHDIDKSFFDDRWLETMPETRSTSNLVVKRSNIRKLWRKMSDCISNQLNRETDNRRWSEISERIDGFDETDIPVAVDLAMAVVLIALCGRNQIKYVTYSADLSKKHSTMMGNMARMVELVMKEMPEIPTYEVSDLHDSQSELNSTLAESVVSTNGNVTGDRRRTSSHSDQVIIEAQLEMDELRAERDALRKEVDRLKAEEASRNDTSLNSEPGDFSLLEKQNEELRVKRRLADEKVRELESASEQYQEINQKLTEENDLLKSTQKEFNLIRNHLDSTKNELDEWRSKANQYQADAELVKKKEKEVKELQGQVKSLNARLEHHVKTATIEEDNKAGILQLRSQIGTLTASNVQLNVALESKNRIVEGIELQLIQYKEKVKELEDRKDELTEERNDLQNKLLFKDSVTPRSLHESMFDAGNLSFEPFSETPKLPLEIENKRLVERIQELEALEPLKGEIITMKSQNGVLEEHNLVITKQMEELERQVAELQEKLSKNQQHASGDVVELKVQLEKANVEVERMREAESRAETKLTDIEELLRKRTSELEINEKALIKAKAVIDELDIRCRPVGEDDMTSVQAFKEMKEENERLRQEKEKLEIALNTTTQSFEQENRLITSAAYQQVIDRSSDNVMSMRARAGADEPQTLLDSQKMQRALPWSILVMTFFIFFLAFISIKVYSTISAPPIA